MHQFPRSFLVVSCGGAGILVNVRLKGLTLTGQIANLFQCAFDTDKGDGRLAEEHAPPALPVTGNPPTVAGNAGK